MPSPLKNHQALQDEIFAWPSILSFREDINREQPFCLPEQARKCWAQAAARPESGKLQSGVKFYLTLWVRYPIITMEGVARHLLSPVTPPLRHRALFIDTPLLPSCCSPRPFFSGLASYCVTVHHATQCHTQCRLHHAAQCRHPRVILSGIRGGKLDSGQNHAGMTGQESAPVPRPKNLIGPGRSGRGIRPAGLTIVDNCPVVR